jgi:hypothetical protein
MHSTAVLFPILAVFLFLLYRRLRRSFGRQLLREKAMWFRVVILSAVCVFLLASPFSTRLTLFHAAIGLLFGIFVGHFSFEHTQVEHVEHEVYYTPNFYFGIPVLGILIGRLIYRFSEILPIVRAASANSSGLSQRYFTSFQRSPVTVGCYFLLAGYYVVYYLSLLREAKTGAQLAQG